MTLETLHPIFVECRASEGYYSKSKMGQSWASGGYIYSTDGLVCVRTPTTDADTPGEFPPAHTLHWNERGGQAVPIPDIDPAWLTVECRLCKGKGEATECPDCDGTGEVECVHCGQDTDCEDCNGSGVAPGGKPVECPECHGSKTKESDNAVRVGHSLINVKYADLLRRHGVASITPGKTPMKPLYFAGDGFEGLLMGMTPGHVEAARIMSPAPVKEASK